MIYIPERTHSSFSIGSIYGEEKKREVKKIII